MRYKRRRSGSSLFGSHAAYARSVTEECARGDGKEEYLTPKGGQIYTNPYPPRADWNINL